jgi:uncharacterized protein (DUF488 family)
VTVFTIGHSNHSLDEFLALLRQHKVSAIADVRSSPFSRIHPQFNRGLLKRMLRKSGIAYVFLGEELGGRTNDRSCYENGQVQYGRIAETALFHEGLSRIVRGAQRYRLALVCAEKEPLACHRALLIARALQTMGIAAVHIHADGHLETQEHAMSRLLDNLGLAKQKDFFQNEKELIDRACAIQERKIAYTEEDTSGAASR